MDNTYSLKTTTITKVFIPDTHKFENWFENIYTTYFDGMFVYAKSITRSSQLAEDVVSDIFMNLYKKGQDVKTIKDIKSYLFRSVKNEAVRAASKNAKFTDGVDEDYFSWQVEKVSPEEMMFEKELMDVIQMAVQKLPEQSRAVFKMVKEEGMSYKEIAKELNVSESTVRTQISRAIKVVKKVIEDFYKVKDVNNTGLSSAMVISMLLVVIKSADIL